MNGRGQRKPLPEGLRPGEREFFAELRRLVDEAGLSTRALERKTSTVRAGTEPSAFYSKSQWARWLNGQALPPRQAVQRLAAALDADGTAGRLLALHQRAALPDQGAGGGDGGHGHGGEPHDARLPPRQVPSVTPDFTGRSRELAELDRLAGGSGGVIVIAGTAGVGKTTLANYFAQRAADRFPDGQLYVNLRGFDPGGKPLDAPAALRGFLEALGAKPEPVRDDPDAMAARYRTLLAGKRLLVIADNARDERQVRPLIPGTSGCLTVVTSRNSLTGLLAQGARAVRLVPFTAGDARQFLVRRLGAARVEREPEAVAELAERCAGLPLAMSVAAAHAEARPRLPLGDLAGELRGRGLDRLETGDEETSARAVFSWSYDDLSEEGRRVFRLLGVAPGPDLGVLAAASLAGLPAARAHQALRELVHAHLAGEHAPGRFTLHDLLRAYAAELAAAIDGRDAVDDAELRLLDHYLHTGRAAALLLAPATDFGALGPPAAGVVTEPPGTVRAATDEWFAVESPALLAACARAAERGRTAHSWQLPWTIAQYLVNQGRWADSAATLRSALAVAERAGDLHAQGHVRYHLAHALEVAGDSEAAEDQLRRSFEAFTATGDRPGQGLALYGRAASLQERGRHAQALPVAREALRLRAEHGLPAAVATSETLVGTICVRLGLHAEAVEHCNRALRISAAEGLHFYQGEALYYLGHARFGTGDYAAAASHFERSAEAFRQIGDGLDLATALFLLAEAQTAAGEAAAARRSRAEAATVIDGWPSAEAARFRAWIAREVALPPIGSPRPDPDPPAGQR